MICRSIDFVRETIIFPLLNVISRILRGLLEVPEWMNDRTCVNSAVRELELLRTYQLSLTSSMKVQIRILLLELKFLHMFFWCLTKWRSGSNEQQFGTALTDIENELKEAGQGLYAAGLAAINKIRVEKWDFIASNLLEKVEYFKPQIREKCVVLLDSSMQSKTSAIEETLKFIDFILKNLRDLGSSKGNKVAPVEEQIQDLEEKLRFFRNLIDFTSECCIRNEILDGFGAHIEGWINKAACLSYLCWIDEIDKDMEARMNIMLSDFLQNIKPCILEVIQMYHGVLKASASSRSETLLTAGTVASFLDFLLENQMIPLEDHREMFHEGLIFLITILKHPPEKQARSDGEFDIVKEMDAVISGMAALICPLFTDEMTQDIVEERNILLSSFLEKIDIVKQKVREHWVRVPNSLKANFPRTNALGFIDFLLGNLKEMLKYNSNFVPFAKHQVLTFQGLLESIRPFLKDIENIENEHKELKDLWMRIISMAYQAEYVIDSFSNIGIPTWYTIMSLSDVLEEIKLAKVEFKKIKEKQICNRGFVIAETSSSANIPAPAQANTSRVDEVVVGFEDEANTIINRLTRGTAELDIVAIVGMPGLGKTTLAHKIFNDPVVQYHFNKCAWCCVSQLYKTRDLLIGILSDVTGVNASQFSLMDVEDLIELLWKSLKGQRYLIVMDDIWDTRPWDNLRRSFPDDHIGSRIIFTSRIHNVSLHAKSGCSPHPLRSLSNEESWELIQKKVFEGDGCPPYLIEIGKQIARNCRGLPLAIVVIAGLLSRKSRILNWWKQIEVSLDSVLANEGCMGILELSYKHLPDCLKPCFLYFGAFREAEIRVRKLIHFWIAEGFIERTKKKTLEDVAEEYLMDLTDRSLVIVADRSSKGGIKTCRVHDLLRELCLAKAKEENFFELVGRQNLSYYSFNPIEFEQYRLCIHASWEPFMESIRTGPRVHSLLFFDSFPMKASCSDSFWFLNNFRCLKVLDMKYVYLRCSFPTEITLVTHLRYLALWCNITYVPSSIAKLQNLEILILKGWGCEINLPSSIMKMKCLRHITIRPSAVFSPDFVEESCQLDNADTLSSISLCNGGETEGLLRRLPKIRKLGCILSQEIPTNCIKFPVLSSLCTLESLNMTYRGKVFPGRKCNRFPSFNFPGTLKKLTLSAFQLPWRAISAIGHLPKLEVLKLRDRAFQGERWDMEDGEFLSLKFLELSHLDIEQWNVSNEPFPCLERLVLQDCPLLEEIPSSFGEISTLQMIEVRWCFRAESSAWRILEEQRDMGNDSLEVIIQ